MLAGLLVLVKLIQGQGKLKINPACYMANCICVLHPSSLVWVRSSSSFLLTIQQNVTCIPAVCGRYHTSSLNQESIKAPILMWNYFKDTDFDKFCGDVGYNANPIKKP